MEALKCKIEELNSEIEAFQAQLPEHGTPSIHRFSDSYSFQAQLPEHGTPSIYRV